MVASRTAVLGAVAAVTVIVLTLVPIGVLSSSELAVYYGVGPVSPFVIAVFAGVAGIILLAVAYDRTDPATGTGVSLVLGVAVTGLSAWWAVETSGVVGGLAVAATFEYHRWTVVGVGAVIVAASAGEAWRVLRPQGP